MLTTQSHRCWAEYSIQEAQRREESGRGKHEAPGERGFKVQNDPVLKAEQEDEKGLKRKTDQYSQLSSTLWQPEYVDCAK